MPISVIVAIVSLVISAVALVIFIHNDRMMRKALRKMEENERAHH